MASTPQATGPLAGIRVLDFTTVISGPFCSQILGDLGADVTKVEPPMGDACRWSGGPFPEPGYSGFLAQFNRNKRSVVLDLKHASAAGVAARLARDADVVLQNYRPRVADRLGIGYDALSAANPALVYVAITGFGDDGPYADLPAYDHVIQGLSGLMAVQGGDGEPQLVKGGVADKSTAMTAANAVTAALFARERGDGSGQRIEVPMVDAYAAFALPEAMMARSFPPRTFDGPTMTDIFRTWATSDGFVVGLVIQDAQYEGLCAALERPDLASDERFGSIGARFANFHELAPLLAEEIRKWPTAEFVARARKAGAPFGPVHDVDDFLADPQVAHNATAPEVDETAIGRVRYLRHPVRYGATPASFRHHAPRLGEHTDALLTEAGYTEDEIAGLRESGAVA